MILIELFLMFIKIAAFNFGGGYAMIPLVASELAKNEWLSTSAFLDIITISQMTPGAIAINTATYVGYKVDGILGALFSTIAIPIPSLILIILLFPLLEKHKNHPIMKIVFYSLKPVVAGLIVTAVYYVAKTTIIQYDFQSSGFVNIIGHPLDSINYISVIMVIVGFIVLKKTKINPIFVLMGAAVIGMLVF